MLSPASIRTLVALALAGASVPAATREATASPLFVPVLTTDFPDPFVLPHAGGYLAYATNGGASHANVQMARSTDLVNWSVARTGDKFHDAMPVLPAWAERGRTWAPEVIALGDRYLLYFTARERASKRQCVGVATSADPRGPFVSASPAPLVCQRGEGGTIDSSPFRDADGALYLLYKSDGNNPAVLRPSRIFSQALSADGLTLTGPATPLLTNETKWEWRVVESPTMVRNPAGGYTLFYSGNHFGWEADQRLSNYSMGYARCVGPLGPCTKASENPILRSYNTKAEGCLSGPGHQTVFAAGGRQFLVFHAWSTRAGCQKADKGRYMYISPLGWRGDVPDIKVSLRAR